MLDKMSYDNTFESPIIFGQDGIYANYGSTLDYEWSYDITYQKITAFNVPTKKASFTVVICRDDASNVANKLYDYFEKNVIAQKPGKLIIGDYYCNGYIIASSKASWSADRTALKLSLTFLTVERWHKDTLRHFNFLVKDESADQINLDYPHDAPYDYTSPLDVKLINTSYAPADFNMVIYGPCSSPTVSIDGHEHTVNVDITSGDRLTIDSVDKKIYITTQSGEITNCFNLRDRDSYIFEKIPVGTSTVEWSGDFSFDITMIEERGEPKWT